MVERREIRDFDIAVIGSGFGGSLLAMIARRLGRSVVLLEKSRHPRFAIGESSTPLANLLLEELATAYGLPRLLPLAKWGNWQRSYPEVACGLKRGFTFYHHTRGAPFAADPERRDQLLVAASPRDEIADMHWYRPDVDHFFVREAQALGAIYLDEVALHDVTLAADAVELTGVRTPTARRAEPLSIRARFVVDATGPRGFLHRSLRLPELALDGLPATQALYNHFSGVHRWADMAVDPAAANAPYPVDDAAVHHVFAGGWVWVLRFGNGITSAGLAATDDLARELRLADGAPAWARLLALFPTLREQFADAQPILDFVHAPRLAFRSGAIAGERWALLPSAAGFVDPLLSTGFPLTLLGIHRLAGIIDRDWGSPRFAPRLQDYAASTDAELAATGRLIAALYAKLGDFESFAALSLLYFAAAGYAEMARRLGRPQLAESFLLHDHPVFGPALRACCERAARPGAPRESSLREQVERAIAPFDVTGLAQRDRNWVPAAASDVLRAAPKLGASRDEVRDLLVRSGFL